MSADHPSEDAAVSAVRRPEDADTFAARICAQRGLPQTEVAYRAWLSTAWHVGYNAGLTRASRLLDRDIKLTEAP